MDRISMITALFSRALVLKSIGGDSLKYIGVTTTALTDGATTNPITIDGDTVTATNGDVALYSGDAFVFNGTIWQASSAISQIFTEIGDLSDLDTEAKTDLVSAINEVNEEKQDDVELSLTPTAVVSDRDIIDGQGNTLSVLAEALTKTASGNPVVITDCAGGKARSLKTTINAIQDLHGYDKPWVGGAYKNKLPMTVDGIKANNIRGTWSGNTYTVENGTFDILTDADGNITGIEINGTFTATVSIKLFLPTPKQDSYILTGCPSGGSTSTYEIWGGVRNSDDTGWIISFKDNGSGYNFSVSAESAYIQVEAEVKSGYTANHVVFKPMIRLSTELDPTFAPYSNICPISGRTAAVITRSDGDEISEDFTIQLGQTVYGADINWDTGVMTVNRECVDLGTLTWAKYKSGTHYRFETDPSNIKPQTAVSENANVISSIYDTAPFLSIYNGTVDQKIGITQSAKIAIIDTSLDNATVEQFKTAMNGVQACYELATPTTIQLTPEQLEMLKGYNRVTIDNGTITLDYIAKAISGNDEEIAPLVGDKATKFYAVNDFIERNDGLYRVTAPIASGASFTANNTVKMSIGEALTYLYNK